jgi:GAF domain
MSTHSSFDRESFENFLASASALQASGLDAQSLVFLIELQKSIMKADLDLDGVMQLIADRTREVAQAGGVAIALLKADHLEYRAGSGSAAPYVGRQLKAVLSNSARKTAREEILRVEDAQSDARIEAEICRQFGANSLLMLPICREQNLVGVLAVLFNQAHAFPTQELLTYQVTAQLVEDLLLNYRNDLEEVIVVDALTVEASATQPVPDEEAAPVTDVWTGGLSHQASIATGRILGLFDSKDQTETVVAPEQPDIFLHNFRLHFAAAAVVIAILTAGWISYNHRQKLAGSAINPTTAGRTQKASADVRQPELHAVSARALAPQVGKVAGSGFKHVRVGRNEIDDVADDVTVRHFEFPPRPKLLRAGTQVNFGDDVTVRYFETDSQVQPAVDETK